MSFGTNRRETKKKGKKKVNEKNTVLMEFLRAVLNYPHLDFSKVK